MSTIRETVEAAGWRFEYDDETRFVGAEHPRGGKFSVCKIHATGQGAKFRIEVGQAIAGMLNRGDEGRKATKRRREEVAELRRDVGFIVGVVTVVVGFFTLLLAVLFA